MAPTPWAEARAIAATDLKLRLRRPATLWLLVILCGLAYSVIPDPATGRSLMVVSDARALYTSQVVAIATAALASMILTFAGFYLTSNALRRDLLAHTGGIIAATPVRSGTYLVGKYLGGAAYLGLVTLAYVANIMVMHLLRGEGPLEPGTYLLTYLLVLGPGILVVAALALLFEAVPLLAGRVGDVFYFFVWMALLTAGAIGAESANRTNILDVTGLGFIIVTVQAAAHTNHIAIGMTPFDASLPAWLLPPLRPSAATLLTRFSVALLALPALGLARVSFHRFDPARVRSGSQAAGGQLLRRLSLLLKPLTRFVSAAGAQLVPRAPAPLRPVVADVVMTLAAAPLLLVGALAAVVAGLIAPVDVVQRGLPIAVSVFLAIALADLSTRDRAAGLLAMLYSLPGIKPGYARLKLGSAALLALLVVLVPALRLTLSRPAAAGSLLIGAAFMAALATALGLLTRTPKAFMGIFLLFFYLVLNGGQVPSLDFAGWNGTATWATRLGYLGAAVALGLVAEGKQRWDLAREG